MSAVSVMILKRFKSFNVGEACGLPLEQAKRMIAAGIVRPLSAAEHDRIAKDLDQKPAYPADLPQGDVIFMDPEGHVLGARKVAVPTPPPPAAPKGAKG